MDDRLTDSLSKYWEEDGEQAWRGFTTGFLIKAPGLRVADLKTADQWIENYQLENRYPSKELGSLIQRRRELLDIHAAMLKAGR
jgi:hypothetical protein